MIEAAKLKTFRCMKDLAIFASLDFLEKEKIGALAGKKVYRKNEFIFREGEPADAVYLIKYGRVRVFKISEGGKEITLDILKEDDLFGENTFFDDAQHTMNAQALEDTFICSCNRQSFLDLLKNPQISLKIIQLLGERLNNYTEQVANIAFLDVKGRISATLLRLAQEYGKPAPEGTMIDIDITHQDLAYIVNASRVMVTNVLIALRQEGVIATRGHRITLLRKEKLAEIVKAV